MARPAAILLHNVQRAIAAHLRFVKSGHNSPPTARAAVRACHMVANMRKFAGSKDFDASVHVPNIAIAANEPRGNLVQAPAHPSLHQAQAPAHPSLHQAGRADG